MTDPQPEPTVHSDKSFIEALQDFNRPLNEIVTEHTNPIIQMLTGIGNLNADVNITDPLHRMTGLGTQARTIPDKAIQDAIDNGIAPDDDPVTPEEAILEHYPQLAPLEPDTIDYGEPVVWDENVEDPPLPPSIKQLLDRLSNKR